MQLGRRLALIPGDNLAGTLTMTPRFGFVATENERDDVYIRETSAGHRARDRVRIEIFEVTREIWSCEVLSGYPHVRRGSSSSEAVAGTQR